MQRRVEPEWLDELSPDDPRAERSRRDLRLLNSCMGHHRLMARVLREAFRERPPRRLVELGAGDGTFLLEVAQQLSSNWKGVKVILVDRQNAVSSATRKTFEHLGWGVEAIQTDVFDWLRQSAARPGGATSDNKNGAPPFDAILANLFLHHFSESQLGGLLNGAAQRTLSFITIEPRRASSCLLFSNLLWFIGCGPVTRHDAPASVRAGFAGNELSRLWPAASANPGTWDLQEKPAGWSSHLFIAQKRET
jgi:hypothetical protein